MRLANNIIRVKSDTHERFNEYANNGRTADKALNDLLTKHNNMVELKHGMMILPSELFLDMAHKLAELEDKMKC